MKKDTAKIYDLAKYRARREAALRAMVAIREKLSEEKIQRKK
jgi:hypothetical protein